MKNKKTAKVKQEFISLMSTNRCLGLVPWNSHHLKSETPATSRDGLNRITSIGNQLFAAFEMASTLIPN